MMHGHEKSDLAIVAGKLANKAEQSAAELVERRAGTKGNASQQSTHWTQSQARVSRALDRIRHVFAVTHPRWEPYAGKPPVRAAARDAGDRVPPQYVARRRRAPGGRVRPGPEGSRLRRGPECRNRISFGR